MSNGDLVHPNERDRRWVGVGQSADTNSRAAGVDAASRAVAGRSASLLIVFCSDSHDLEQLLAGINEVSGNAPLIGCSTAGEIATAGPATSASWSPRSAAKASRSPRLRHRSTETG